jgi:2-hydroxychromene-2-carboxylate isomerase
MNVECYFDYTCSYSYRAWLWLQRLQGVRRELEVSWRSFVLKEVNREPNQPSALEGPAIDSVAVLALAAGAALRGSDSWLRYHDTVFRAMHSGGPRPAADEVLLIAAEAGLDVAVFKNEQETWLTQVAGEHADALRQWGVFGTPTLVLGEEAAVYLKLEEVPHSSDGELWDALWTISVSFPEVVELKRPFRALEPLPDLKSP